MRLSIDPVRDFPLVKVNSAADHGAITEMKLRIKTLTRKSNIRALLAINVLGLGMNCDGGIAETVEAP